MDETQKITTTPSRRDPLLDLLTEVEAIRDNAADFSKHATIAYLRGWEECADHLVCLVRERIQGQNNPLVP